MNNRYLVLATVIGLCLVFLGCGADDDESADRKAFVGTVEGTTALAALVVQDDRVSFYVCGHEDTLASHTRWYGGDLGAKEGTFNLTRDEWKNTGILTADGASGTLEDPDGKTYKWELLLAAPGSKSDLYSVMDSDCRTGVIVIDGDQPQVQGAWCSKVQGLVQQVTPMQPLSVTSQGLEVSVDVEGTLKQLFVVSHKITK